MRMKILIPMGLFAVAAALGGSSPLLAQPRPPPHDEHRGPPDGRKDSKDDHRGPDGRRDAHDDDHRAPPDVRRDADEARDHFIQREEREREARRQARKDAAAWAAARQQRAIERRRDVNTTWGVLVNNADARAELSVHAERMARLSRVVDLAEDRNEPVVVARARVLIAREITRHTTAMVAIRVRVVGR